MAALYLLDTNIASFFIRGSSVPLRERIVRTPIGKLAISAVTEAELRFGIARHPEATRLRASIQEFLLRVQSLPWTSEAAVAYGSLRASVEAAGTPIGNIDLLIAAHALALDAVLVTNDHVFRRIKGLKLEDWTRN